jgi:esterase/lipase
MRTAVEWLQEQYNQYPKYEEQIYEQDWEQAKEMETKQNEKYNELKEVIEDIIQHLDEGRVLTLRKDSIIVEVLRNSINN